MSVYKSKRGVSTIQYVENARKLQVFTIRNCVKFPKRYTYILVQEIAHLAENIDTHVRVAESIMPTNLHEAQMKRDELTYPFGLLNSLDDKLQLMHEIVSDNPDFKTEFNQNEKKIKTFRQWMDNGRFTIADVETAYQSWRGHMRRGNSFLVLRKIDAFYNSLFKRKDGFVHD
nr:MAG TPA: hypothetical protein [Caudoviricetes sp.]